MSERPVNALLTDDAVRAVVLTLTRKMGDGETQTAHDALRALIDYHRTEGREALVPIVAHAIHRHGFNLPCVDGYYDDEDEALARAALAALLDPPEDRG